MIDTMEENGVGGVICTRGSGLTNKVASEENESRCWMYWGEHYKPMKQQAPKS